MADVTFQTLDTELVDDYAALLASLMQAAYPELNLRPGGVLYDLVIQKAAAAHVYEATALDQLKANWNMAAVRDDPEAADPAIVDALLSNFNTTRSEGTKAIGEVEIVLKQQHALTISAGTAFLSGSLRFVTSVDHVVVLDPDDRTSDSDRVLIEQGDGTWSFRVSAAAEAFGLAGNVPAGTGFTVSPQPIYFSEARAAGDFSGGSDPDTNASVVERASAGITGKVLASPSHAAARLYEVVPSSTALSVIGMQDPEMTRDQRSILGVSVGGRVDAYLRTQAYVDTTVVTVEAELVDAALHRYSVTLTRDQAAGVFDVIGVTPEGAGASVTLTRVSTTWGYDVSDLDVHPDVRSADEAAFSRYQTVTLVFDDPGDAGSYDVYVLRVPGVDVAQDACLDPDHRDPTADWLVRAPIPIVTGITLVVKYRPGVTVDASAVQAAVIDAVNAQSFVKELSASVVVDAASSALPKGAYVHMPINMVGEILRPDRTSNWLRSGNSLVVPTHYDANVSSRTCAFFASTSSVSVSTEAA